MENTGDKFDDKLMHSTIIINKITLFVELLSSITHNTMSLLDP